MDTFAKVNKKIYPDYYKFAGGATPDTEEKMQYADMESLRTAKWKRSWRLSALFLLQFWQCNLKHGTDPRSTFQ